MVIAIIQARMGSTRLPGKVMLTVNGRPIIDYMIERLRMVSSIDKIIIATTNNPADERIVKWCNESNVLCFRGDENDVLSRYYECANKFNATTIVRMTSDCPLIDPLIVDEVVKCFNMRTDIDFVSNTVPLPCLYPDGMDVEVFSMKLLKESHHEAKLPSEREHVTFYMWKTGKYRTYRLDPAEDISQYRFTVDYIQDFEIIKAVLGGLYIKNKTFSLGDLIEFMHANPHLGDLQKNIVRNEGWQNSFKKDQKYIDSKL